MPVSYTHLDVYKRQATDPKELKRLASTNLALAIGEGNDDHISREADDVHTIVCAWGDNCNMAFHRDLDVIASLRAYDLYCIRRTAKGNPAHPVREPYTDAPVMFYSKLIQMKENRELSI